MIEVISYNLTSSDILTKINDFYKQHCEPYKWYNKDMIWFWVAVHRQK